MTSAENTISATVKQSPHPRIVKGFPSLERNLTFRLCGNWEFFGGAGYIAKSLLEGLLGNHKKILQLFLCKNVIRLSKLNQGRGEWHLSAINLDTSHLVKDASRHRVL
ncbi:hypothetical protein RRG08_003161 [Elysia crispata]|uniref:Uncharacterized protein n=1 Tax=Elysia crispata TaxID=231223 RepID=A0AAE1B8W6_9GAST|nr:hypothetical protein RRG08_003161 [Elysia crispata]